jgi:glycosyltransferase involved in cell wall biosynthesis
MISQSSLLRIDEPPASEPVHCLIFINTLDSRVGGPQTTVLDLCRVLPSERVRITLATMDKADLRCDWTDDAASNPRVVELPGQRMNYRALTREALDRITPLIASADVVHLHGVWEYCNIQVARICRKLNKPYIATVHGMLDDWSMKQGAVKKQAFLALGGRTYLERAACVHTTAVGERDQVESRFDGLATEVLPYLFDETPFTRRQKLSRREAENELGLPRTDRPRVLFLSRIHVKKGLETLLASAALLDRWGVEADFVIAGTGEAGYEASIRNLASELKLGDRVTFLGHVTGGRKLAAIDACDMLAIPTSQENFGLVFVEALASGLPVVTTRGTDIWSDLQKAGAEIIDRTPEAFAVTIRRLVRDRAALSARGEQGRRWVLKHMSASFLSLRYEELYRRVAGSRRDDARLPAFLNRTARSARRAAAVF